MIPYGRQLLDDEDIRAVVAVLRSDFLTQGPEVPAFEQALSGHCLGANAVAVNSATSALHLACLALGVGVGDIVWTSPNTFVASANCARYCGASIDFVDIDGTSRNMSAEALARKLEVAAASGKLPKVVIPVHFAGAPCDMRAIGELSKRYGFSVIEDASHALGARYEDSIVGDCRHSDITVFSFHPVKIITTGEGGAAMTRSDAHAQRLRVLRTHGITRDRTDLENRTEGPWYYEQQCLGFNYRMTDIQAALGRSQLRHLDAWMTRRNALADAYDRELSGLPLLLPTRPRNGRSACHLYVVEVDASRTSRNRREVFEQLRGLGIGVNVHYIPVHLQPDFRRLGFGSGQFPNSEAYYARCLTLPLFPAMSDEEQSTVVMCVRSLFE